MKKTFDYPPAFQRDDILAYLKRAGFSRSDAAGYWEKAYGRDFGCVILRVGMPAGQNCATLAVVESGAIEGTRSSVMIGVSHTVEQIDALWSVLDSFDFDNNQVYRDRYAMPRGSI